MYIAVVYLMSFCIISFADPDTQTSSIKIIKQNAGLNLYKLKALAVLHWEVMRDKIGVEDASAEVSRLMVEKPVVCLPPLLNAYLSDPLCSTMLGSASSLEACAQSSLVSPHSTHLSSTCVLRHLWVLVLLRKSLHISAPSNYADGLLSIQVFVASKSDVLSSVFEIFVTAVSKLHHRVQF